MTDYETARLVSLIVGSANVLVPLAGAVVAGTFLRRRGRNARLAMIGCLVMAVSPIVVSVVLAFATDSLYDELGLAMAINAPVLLSLPFHLAGLGLIVAGALAAPAPALAPQAVYLAGPLPAVDRPPTDAAPSV
ncbi:hypothetical protein [Kitasatospora sp. NPDC002965]|uniref:hypothetical protein n=1 Tax=unclassified Kitasatospora TaxID=2633591 RepID=UPI0033A7A21A